MNMKNMGKSNDKLLSSARLLNLKPLRDLAQNWDVDIASCLQDYLRQLESAGHSVNINLPSQLLAHGVDDSDESDAVTNFAQAAVLLQNSSSIYGRKVEYLHSLVYAALEKLLASSANHSANGKSRNSSSSLSPPSTKSTSRNDEDVLRFQAYDPDCQFLLLDDVLPIDSTGTKINLKTGMTTASNQKLGELNITPDENAHFNTTRLSLGGSLSVTRVETTTPIRNHTHIPSTINGSITSKGNTPTAATKAMVLETLFSEGGGGGGGNLRLMSGVCDINCSGALIMPGANYDSSEDQTINVVRPEGHNTLSESEARIETLTGEKLDLSVEGDPHFNPKVEKESGICSEREGLDPFEGYNDHNDDDGVGFVLTSQDNCEHEIGTPLVSNEQQQLSLPQRFAGDKKDFTTIDPVTNSPKQDPWVMLDPHSGEKSKHKPLQVGITYCLPKGLQDTPSNSVTGSHTKNTSMQQSPQKPCPQTPPPNEQLVAVDGPSGDVCLAAQAYRSTLHAAECESNNNSSCQSKRQCLMEGTCIASKYESPESSHDFLLSPSSSSTTFLSLKHLAYGEEFLYIAKAQKKKKAVERRKLLKMQVEQIAESSDAAKVHENFNHVYNDDDTDGGCDDGAPFRFDDGSGDDNDNGDTDFNGIEDNRPPGIVNADLSNFDNVFCRENNINGNDYQNGGNTTTDIIPTVATFDALCRVHLQEFSKGAEKYAIETQLSKRVKTWQSKLAIILDEEEERQVFDIRVYQKWILDKVAKVVKKAGKGKTSLDSDQYKEQQNSNDNVIDFASITRDKEPHEVSRIFLSSLMLCNTNNTVLKQSYPDKVATPDMLKLELLSYKFGPSIENYLS